MEMLEKTFINLIYRSKELLRQEREGDLVGFQKMRERDTLLQDGSYTFEKDLLGVKGVSDSVCMWIGSKVFVLLIYLFVRLRRWQE